MASSSSQKEVPKGLDTRDLRVDAGAYIGAQMRLHGIKHKDLADKFGVTGAYISRITSGSSTPNPSEAGKWAKALGLNDRQTKLLHFLLARSKALRSKENGAADYVHLIEQELDRIDGLARESVAAGLTLTATIRQLADLIREFGLQVPDTLKQALLKSEQTYELFAARLGMEESEPKSNP